MSADNVPRDNSAQGPSDISRREVLLTLGGVAAAVGTGAATWGELSRVAATSMHTGFFVGVLSRKKPGPLSAILRGNAALSCGAATVRVNQSQAVSSGRELAWSYFAELSLFVEVTA